MPPITTADIRNSQWDEGPVRYVRTGPTGRPVETTVTVVFRKSGGEWEPWVVVAKSALMDLLGKDGLGLYAARPFKRDDVIGMYDGTVVGTYASREEALASDMARKLVRRQHDKLITRRVPNQRGVQLVDGVTGGPPYLHRCNDPRGTPYGPNVEIGDTGYMKVTRHRGIPAFDFGVDLAANIDAELRFDYGEGYWSMMQKLGTSPKYAIDADDD